MNLEEQQAIIKKKYLAKGPGDSATKDYIARKYLGGGDDDKKKKKKKKQKTTIHKGNLGILDDEEISWKQVGTDDRDLEKERRERERELEEASFNSKAVFRGRNDNWQTVEGGDPNDDEEEEQEDEKPVIVEEFIDDRPSRLLSSSSSSPPPQMSSGQRAGLLTSEEIRREAMRAQEAEERMLKKLKEADSGRFAETVHRDETGRKIDPKIKKAEEARKRKEAIEKEEQRMEWGKGLVQRSEEKERLRQLQEEKDKPLARYIDDDEFNQGLREKEHWNDPAAGFLTSKSGSSKRLARPKYKGPWKPNRYMIAPGYRWDGVDRSNGFEDQYLLQQNSKKARAIEAHAWSTEDM